MSYKGTGACTKEWDGLEKKKSSSQSTMRRTIGQVDHCLEVIGRLNNLDVHAANGKGTTLEIYIIRKINRQLDKHPRSNCPRSTLAGPCTVHRRLLGNNQCP